jgi:hypothetical protein
LTGIKPSRGSDAGIGLTYTSIAPDFGRRAGCRHSACLEHIGAVGDGERGMPAAMAESVRMEQGAMTMPEVANEPLAMGAPTSSAA